MNVYRLIGLALLLIIAASTLRAESLVSRKLTGARFLGWVNLQDVCTDIAIDQVWRQRLYDIPRGLDGYTMVSYKVARTESPTQAAQVVKDLNHQRRFNDYIAKGYKVTNEPWMVRNYKCIKFVVRGTDPTDDQNVAHRAEMYTFAVPADNWFVWLEVRQVISGPDLATLDRAMEKTGGQRMAEDLVDVVYSLWNPIPDDQSPVTPEPPKPDNVTPPAEPPKPDEATPPVEPPKPVEAPKPVEPPVAPPKPDEVTPPVQPPKPDEVKLPAEPPKPVEPPVEPPKPVTPVEPPKPVDPPKPVEPLKPVAPALPAGTKKWTTPDGFLSLVIPEAWAVSGKTVFTVAGPAGAGVRILPPESYASADELTRALKDFTETQQEISGKNFSSKAFSVGGATGVEVHYSAVHGHGMHLYYFGKSGRLWRLEIDVNDASKPLTPELVQMVSLITVQ
ncbi:MAG: hypothetical protein ACYDCO_13105 [Armatimonadota bacterium]